MNQNLNELESTIAYEFKDRELLIQALTHRSYLNENLEWDKPHNERLEFLGDAVLELVVTEYLYIKYPNPEGELTNWRAALVNSKMLSEVASKFNLNDFLMLSKGESKDTGRARQYILANAVEALIGSVYLDGGYGAATNLIHKFILPELPAILSQKTYRDAKSVFQERAQEQVSVTPRYEVVDQWGPDHAKKFKVGVYLEQELVAEGVGDSKQEAQQEAAKLAIDKKSW